MKLLRNAGTGRDGNKTAARIVGTVPKLSKKGKHNYKTAAECRDGYKTAARMVGTVPKLSKKGKHNYKTAAECRDGPGRLKNCSENGRDGVKIKQERQT